MAANEYFICPNAQLSSVDFDAVVDVRAGPVCGKLCGLAKTERLPSISVQFRPLKTSFRHFNTRISRPALLHLRHDYSHDETIPSSQRGLW